MVVLVSEGIARISALTAGRMSVAAPRNPSPGVATRSAGRWLWRMRESAYSCRCENAAADHEWCRMRPAPYRKLSGATDRYLYSHRFTVAAFQRDYGFLRVPDPGLGNGRPARYIVNSATLIDGDRRCPNPACGSTVLSAVGRPRVGQSFASGNKVAVGPPHWRHSPRRIGRGIAVLVKRPRQADGGAQTCDHCGISESVSVPERVTLEV